MPLFYVELYSVLFTSHCPHFPHEMLPVLFLALFFPIIATQTPTGEDGDEGDI